MVRVEMCRPEVSVVIPAYQAAEKIRASLRALNRQTVLRQRYEILVVDDGSTDGTADCAREGGADRVLALLHQGPAAARNAGLEAAEGEFVLFLDADCRPSPDWIEQMLRPFADPRVMGVKGALLNEQREVVARLAQCEFEERYDRLESRAFIDFVDAGAAAFRRDLLLRFDGFDPAFPYANGEDAELSYRLARAGNRFAFNRRATVYHDHPAGWWPYLRLKASRGYWRMVVYRLHPGKALRDSYTPQLMKLQVLLACLSIGLIVLALAFPLLAWAAAACVGGLVIGAVPFTRLVARRDPGVAPWAPLFVCARALAFAVGVAAGLIGMLFFRPALSAGRGSAAPPGDRRQAAKDGRR
jgi:glycosyltransferase involved in cell wall biosynthesis